MDSGAGEQSTLAVIERKIVDLCREGGLPEPDVVLDNKNGEFTALWFESKVAVVIESDGGFDLDPELFADPAPAEPGDADLELELDAPEPPPEFFEALDHMAWLCEQGGFPKPDHAAFDERERLIQFTWDHDPFDPTWQIDEFIESVRTARARQMH